MYIYTHARTHVGALRSGNMYLSIFLSVYLYSIYTHIYLSYVGALRNRDMYISIYLSINLSVYYLSIHTYIFTHMLEPIGH